MTSLPRALPSSSDRPSADVGLFAVARGLSSRAGSSPIRSDQAWKIELCWCFFALACWFFTRQYYGVVADARIYLGRALADLSPSTIGRDLMFVHDGQSSFSLFPMLARLLVQRFGAPMAGAGIAFTGICLWAWAFTALAFKLAPRRTAWAMLVFVAVLPQAYGGFSVINFGQAAAIPRPFAEAAVLAALWAAMDKRWVLTAAFLTLAGLFHPIMAMCGVGVVFLMMTMQDLRWLIALGVGGALVLGAAISGLPLADRLFHRVDPEWLAVLHNRNPYLFTAMWPLESWGRVAVQLATTIVAAMLLKGRARALFACSAAVGVAGLVLTFIGGDLYPSLLILQVQPWRAMWLVGVLANAGAVVCVAALWRRGPLGHVTLVLLALGWLMIEWPVAILLAGLGLGAQLLAGRIKVEAVSFRLAKLAWLSLVLFAVFTTVVNAIVFVMILKSKAPDILLLNLALAVFDFPSVIIAPLVCWLLLTRREKLMPVQENLALAAATVMVLSALLCWKATLPTASFQGPDAKLLAMMKGQPGEVQWIGGDTQAWTLADRPNWASDVQGAGTIFARDAALSWRGRIDRLISLNLGSPQILSPWAKPSPTTPRASTASLAALCAMPDGPAWIVSPILAGEAAPILPGVRLWSAPYVTYLRSTKTETSVVYTPVRTYAVIPCIRKAKLSIARS